MINIRFKKTCLLILIGLCVTGLFIFYLVKGDHVFTVIPHQVYRSAQLSKRDFEHYIPRYHIKSVINLRGSNPGQPWYDDEMKAMKDTGTVHYDLAMPVRGTLSAEQLRALVNILNQAPRPVLIHCRHGIDRTGFASSIVIILSGEPSLWKAKLQDSYLYFAVDSRTIGHSVLPAYEAWLKENHKTNSREAFLEWVNSPNVLDQKTV